MCFAHGEKQQSRGAGQYRVYQRPCQRDQCFFAQVVGALCLDRGVAHGKPADGEQHKAFDGKSLPP